jgi:hypothetical protein
LNIRYSKNPGDLGSEVGDSNFYIEFKGISLPSEGPKQELKERYASEYVQQLITYLFLNDPTVIVCLLFLQLDHDLLRAQAALSCPKFIQDLSNYHHSNIEKAHRSCVAPERFSIELSETLAERLTQTHVEVHAFHLC